jgi:hypothetical protein
VRKHLENIYTRLEVSNRAAAVARASGNCARVGVERFDADCLIGVVPCAYGRASRATRGCWPRRCPRARCRCWSSSSPQPGHAGVCARRLTCPFRVRPGQPTALGRYPRQGGSNARSDTPIRVTGSCSASVVSARLSGAARFPGKRSRTRGADQNVGTTKRRPAEILPGGASRLGVHTVAFPANAFRHRANLYYSAVVAQTVKV